MNFNDHLIIKIETHSSRINHTHTHTKYLIYLQDYHEVSFYFPILAYISDFGYLKIKKKTHMETNKLVTN